ncbi:YgjV family protein [Morganella morganii]|uniref:YgjV family protein n=1 Tax=Morganella morganii TaxID=582 RepID=UPI0011642EAC|nr:YgjV family protein [Morganella morganii]EKT0591021.1 YgjV family protein [Morganella morganii]EKU0268743.1 YgjV family protein [Morganella morganii]ELF0882850.1 YgjV family protein [Morganella morganii]ELT0453016.1 YgjV family protein [Morganella morganii]MBC3994263.1 YgjV family protein [Morganella morganii]
MDYLYYAGQGLGIVAFIIGTTVFVQRNERKLKIRLSIYTAIMASHFFLLGAYPAGISATLNSIRTYVSISHRQRWVLWLFVSLTLVLAVPNIRTWQEVLPVTGTLMSTFAFFLLTGLRMRYVLWCSTACWVVYNAWLGTVGGTLIESTFLVINGWAIFRFRRLIKQGINPFS